MKKRKYVTPEDKARILAEAKQDGCVLTDLAKKYNINLDTLYSWRYKESKMDQHRDTSNGTFVEAKVSPSEYRDSEEDANKKSLIRIYRIHNNNRR
jgi:transposase-like protein